jgi:hypothetical protein
VVEEYCAEHSMSKSEVALKIGYKNRSAFYEVLGKRRNKQAMKIEKWLSLSTLLNKSIEELIELYGSEVE